MCTMAERDYALEMWRLLDPDSRLINSVQLSDRMVCVKSGKRIVSFLDQVLKELNTPYDLSDVPVIRGCQVQL